MSTFQHDLFSPTSCNPCLLTEFSSEPDKLSKCLGCKLILYCSAAHQKLDWRIHKKFCQAAGAVLTSHKADHIFAINGPIKTLDDLNVTTLKVKYMLRTILKRPLSYHEEELTSFPVLCAICYSTKLSKLYQCKRCNAVSYCCEEHQQQDSPTHQTECSLLKMYYCKFKIKCDSALKPTFRENCNLFESNLTNAMKTMFGIEFDPDPSEKLAEYQKFSFVSDFSCVATVTYIMKHLEMKECSGTQFTIYVAGATMDEMWFTPTHVQFFLAHFPHIFKLNVIFIGPEMPDGVCGKETTINLDEGRSLYQSSHKTKLEEYFKEGKHIKPNLIVCFNCGFSENTQNGEGSGTDPWYKALRYMLGIPGVPLLFTSYTSLEADFDFGAVMKVMDEMNELPKARVERIIPKQLNPYKDMRPLRNWALTDPERIFHRNGYVQAVRVQRDN